MGSARTGELRELWDHLEQSPAGSGEFRARRVRSRAPVSVYAALRENDKARSLVFEGPLALAPRARTSFPGEGISFNEGRAPKEGIFRLAASLEGILFEGPFEAMCCDLIGFAEANSSPADALNALARRMAVWMASLRRRGGLNEEDVRGLLGELYCLSILAERSGWQSSITSWTGHEPGSKLHDITANSAAWEVKASAGAGSSVWINGLDQLDDSGLSALVLAHVAMMADPEGKTLKGLVEDLRTDIRDHDPTVVAEFERKLVAAGFVGNEPAAEAPFRLVSVNYYRVADEFPRILRDQVTLGVEEAKYQLRLAALQPFKVDADEAVSILVPGGTT